MADADHSPDRGFERLAARQAASLELVAALIKPIAGEKAEHVSKTLFSTYGGLRQILAADVEAVGLPEPARSSLRYLHQAEQLLLELMREPLHEAPLLDSGTHVRDYLSCAMGHLATEQIRVLHLDAAFRLIRDDIVATGGRSCVRIGVEAILRRSILLDASAIIIAHNHPSGRLEPTQSDLEGTRRLSAAAKTLGIELVDHWIVAAKGAASLRAASLL
jgi:DNA repair protein RadC